MKVKILGCGTSSGVPMVAFGWGRCDPTNPKNRRLRASIYIETSCGLRILVDTTPDCRQQLLAHNIRALDAVFFTHTHADHCHGIDELRWICQAMSKPIPVFGAQESLDELEKKFGYCFSPLSEKAKGNYYKPLLLPHGISGTFHLKKNASQQSALNIQSFIQDHGFSKSLGFRIDNFAYSTDVVNMSEANFALLEGLDVWVVDALQYKPHPTHAHLERTVEWIERVKPKRAFLTHMNASMDYATLMEELPSHIRPAYDGLEIVI